MHCGNIDFGVISPYIRVLLAWPDNRLADCGGIVLKALLLQSAIVAVVAALAGWWVGARGAYSALIGGASYLVPNLLFVLRLRIAAASGRANAVTFMAGEFFKVAATIGILIVAQRLYDVHWLALLVGLFAALKANLFAFLLKT